MSFILKFTREHPNAMFWITNFGYVSFRSFNDSTFIFASSTGKCFMVDYDGRAFARKVKSKWEPFNGVLQPSEYCTCWEYIYEEAYLQNLSLPAKGTHKEYILKVWKQLADVWFLRRTVKSEKEEKQGIKKILKLSELGKISIIISELTYSENPPTLQSAVKYIYFLQNNMGNKDDKKQLHNDTDDLPF